MGMEGRGYSELHRNTSEELFIKTVMESSIGMPAPTMEMLGFKNLMHNFRTDSEELFKSWLTAGENNGGGSRPTCTGHHRPRQASRRISTELAGLVNQQIGNITQKKPDDITPFPHPAAPANDSCNDPNSNRTGVEKGLPGSNLFLAKAWFHSSQPMTRSRSSELRRRYDAMHNSQTAIGAEAMQKVSAGDGHNNFKQETTETNRFNISAACHNPNSYSQFMSPSNSSSSTFHNAQGGNCDKISSVVSMLKGTLERKKLSNHMEKECAADSSFGYYGTGILGNTDLNLEQAIFGYENQAAFQNESTLGALKMIEESLSEEVRGTMNMTQMRAVSREPSQSESSPAAPVISNGLDICEGPSMSVQAPSVCESSRNQMGNGISPENSSRTKDYRECIQENLKDNQKRRGLVRYGSVTSSGPVERGDPTKKRRVERSRKMAEAKERSSTPVLPTDMQSILKRCENLEKEVRSLKLNLAFMNRKDSEQTKQIEELQKQNQDLGDEKERLLEEIERIISETGNA